MIKYTKKDGTGRGKRIMRKNDAFAGYHPYVTSLYFAVVLAATLCAEHPVLLLLSLASALCLCLVRGEKRYVFGICLPVFLLTALINPAFSHAGVTVLAYFPTGNPLTLESILYGLRSGMQLSAVLLWFSYFSAVFSSDKLLFLFGRVSPSFALLVSVTLRFLPRIGERFRSVREAQTALGEDPLSGSLTKKVRGAVSLFSSVAAWSLESAVIASDSMRSRGYGTGVRTYHTVYALTRRDKTLLFSLSVITVSLVSGFLSGAFSFRWYPYITDGGYSSLTVILFLFWAVLCFLPLILYGWEVRRWKRLRSGI